MSNAISMSYAHAVGVFFSESSRRRWPAMCDAAQHHNLNDTVSNALVSS